MSTRKSPKDKAKQIRPIIFTGPSAPIQSVQRLMPSAEVLPPISRGVLYNLRESGAGIFLIIDGVFSHQLAVPPREIVDVIRDGALVLGASSMGALRAAECWPVGMRGVGLIYRLYRAGVLDSDDEVAVATNPEQGFAAVSVPLINVRLAISRAIKARLLDRNTGSEIIAVAQHLFFAERQWRRILNGFHSSHDKADLGRYLAGFDQKREDALKAISCLHKVMESGSDGKVGEPSLTKFARLVRYPGHDRCVGLDPALLGQKLAIWLLASGRYQKFIWALVASEPEFYAKTCSAHERPAAIRDALVTVLSRICENIETYSARIWDELDFLDQLDAEIMRWYAVQETAAIALKAGLIPTPSCISRVREELAILHGLTDWKALLTELSAGRLFGAIPFEWVEDSCLSLASARTLASHADNGRLPLSLHPNKPAVSTT